MPKFASGVVRFQNDVFPQKRKLFEKLSLGQAPEAMFITCSDSRVETAMITQTAPGDMFVVRNAGNIVPPHSTHTGGTTATIEFAVSVLKVPHIVICGHSECGAMKGALHPESLKDLPHVAEWLAHTRAAVDIVNALGAELSEEEKVEMLLEQNVILQLNHLKTHPAVALAMAEGTVALHGWVYDIKTGGVRAFDETQGKFVPFENRYAEQIARAAADACEGGAA